MMLNPDFGYITCCLSQKYDVPSYNVFYKGVPIVSFISFADALNYCIDHYSNDIFSCDIFLSIRFDFQGGLEDVVSCSTE